MNVFIAATLVAFVASALSGLGAHLLGSLTVDTAMIASVLLLVPGVPLLNALNDILEGRPTLGSARAVWVVVTLVFLTVGVWLGQMLLGEWRLVGAGNPAGAAQAQGVAYLLHQTLFGGLAAIGFGVLFNMGGHALVWCGAAGALALAVRTTGLGLGWTLEGASFAAALAVGSGVQLSPGTHRRCAQHPRRRRLHPHDPGWFRRQSHPGPDRAHAARSPERRPNTHDRRPERAPRHVYYRRHGNRPRDSLHAPAGS